MFNFRIVKTVAFIMVLMMSVAVIGCSKTAEKPQAQTNELSGTIQITGSTSVQPLSEELAKAFMAKNPKVRINVAGGGSGAGVKSAQEGTADIGAASRELKQEEKGIQEFAIALDGIAIIVNKENKISDLKAEDIKKIFAGEITDWSAIGGEKGVIHVYNREEGSGTRGAFEELVMGKDGKITDKAGIQNSTGAVRTAVAGDKTGIGYISLGSVNNEIKAVKVEGVEASEANVKNKSYKIFRPFLYLTQKAPEGITKAYIEWVLSAEGQELVKQHFIPVK